MACPGAGQLQALLRGQVTPLEEAELSQHLEGCVECRQRLEASAGGADLIPRRTTEDVVPSSTPSPALVQVIDTLRRFQPQQGERGEGTSESPSDATSTKYFGRHVEAVAPTPMNEPSATHRPSASHDQRAPTRWWRRRLTGAGLCVLLGSLWLVLDVEPLDLKLRALSYDLPFRLRGPIRPQEVLIVSMDAELQRQLNPERTNQWSRALHAKLLRQAMALGVELVVFDITFAQSRDDTAADQDFAEALRAASGKVALGAAMEPRDEANALLSDPILPIPAFESASAWGLVNLDTNRDGRIRQHYVAPDDSHPSLAWKAAELLGKAPAAPLRPRWINYYGPRSTLPSIPYDRFLEQPAETTNLLSGRIVFVGLNPTKPEKQDEYPTPFTSRSDETVTGVHIHATVFLNLIRTEWLEELSWPLNCLLIIGLGSGFALGFSHLRPAWRFALGLAGFFVLLVGACLLVWFKHRWFPWLIVGVVQIPCALLWSLLAYPRRFDASTFQHLNGPTVVVRQPAPAAVELRRLPEIPDHVPLRCVGRGAYGEVWLARDVIGTFHAVKVVSRNTFTQNEPFEREFRGIQKFTPISRLHPGWVHILHVGRNEAQGYFYYIMELGDDETTGQQIDPERYVPKSLSGELRKRGALPLDECLSLGVALADALEHLHKHALIHRDIKPSNVIFVRGAPKFTDIGLVTDVRSRREISWIGTEGYMAPEGPGTPAADVFGLGKLIYEVATGRDCGAFPEMLTALSGQASSPEWQQFHRILLRACEENPTRRYPSAVELHGHLSELLNQMKS